MKTMNGDPSVNPPKPVSTQLLYVLLGSAAILMLPLLAMQLSNEMKWGPFDFGIFGLMLMTIGSLYVFVSRLVRTRQQRMIVGLGLGLVFFLCWAELAVGIFGSPFAGS